jgi:uncharacterized protein involved in outer membrane biogenesis
MTQQRAHRRLWRNLAISVGALAVLVIGVLLVFDWNWLKGPIERRVAASTGRALEIQGNIQGQWRLHPRISFDKVRFANPEWAQSPDFVTAERIEFQVALIPLLARRVHLIDVVLIKPVIALERLPDGRATWHFDREQRDPDSAPRIDAVSVDAGLLELRDALNAAQLRIALEEEAGADNPNGLRFSIKGRFRGEPMDLVGSSTSLLALRERQQPLPIALKGAVAGSNVDLQGTVEGLPQFERLSLRYRVSSASLKRLAPLFRVPLPETPPYDVSGQLVRDGSRWETTDMRGKVGSSDLSGQVVVQTGKDKPELEARLTSKLLDPADLGPLIGTQRAGQQPAKKAQPPDPQRILPSRTFDLSRVDALNAKVLLSAQRVVRAANFPFDNFRANFTLQDAQITIDPLEFGMADGTLRARVSMDARKPPMIVTAAAGQVRGVRVAKIFPKDAAVGEAAGVFAGSFDLRGTGNSIGGMLGTSTGRTTMLLADGRVPNLMPAIADLDGARIIRSVLGRKPEFVQCAAIDLTIKNGVATPTVALFETESTVLDLTGAIDLANERLELKLTQAPKKPSFLSVRTPILITGRFKDPVFTPDVGPLAGRAAAAVVLGLISPLASLFATLETGPGENGSCPELRRGLPPGERLQEGRAPRRQQEPVS